MNPTTPSRPPVLATAVYASTALLAATMLPGAWPWALCVELAAAGAWVHLRGSGARIAWAAAVLGAVRLGSVAVLAVLRLPSGKDLVGLSLPDLGVLLTPQMLGAAAGTVWSRTPPALPLVLGAALLGLAWSLRRPDHRWRAPVLTAALVPVLVLGEPSPPPEPRKPATMETLLGLEPVTLTPETLSPRHLPGKLGPAGRYERVLLVVLESVGAANVAAHLERHPEGPFARLWRRSVRLTRVVATSNVSHMAQPALLSSREYTRRLGRHMPFPKHTRARWGFGTHFAAKGWRTVLESSQDERWLGMSAVTLKQRWTHRRHAPDVPDEATYKDACGTRKAFDSGTVARLEARLAEQGSPWFAYLNLQNTHYPYVVESDPEPLDRALSCRAFTVLPAKNLALAEDRFERALDESLERLARLVERLPDTLVVVTGDHAEHFESGRGFGHSKSTRPEETRTFAMFSGPGLEDRELDVTVSALDLLPTVAALVHPKDLEKLPRDLVQGEDVLASVRSRLAFTTSYGLGPARYAAEDGRARVTVEPEGVRCDEGGERACEALHRQLAFWLSCKTAFYAKGLRYAHHEPCMRLARERHARE